jgi:hypothetical protein
MPTERSKLVKKLDKIFSIYIRIRKTDDSGYGNCYTCGSNVFWKECDAGHFMSRACIKTRWDILNVQMQCKRCNGFRSGEQFLFSKALDSEYGSGTAERLQEESRITAKFSILHLRELYTSFKNLVEQEKSIRNME